MRTAHLHDIFGSLSPTTLLPLMTVSRLLTSGRAKRQALSTPSPGEPTQGPACRYLSLQFQTIQSCILYGYPVATTVQPRFAQECAYTSRNPAKPAARSHCRCDACHLARLRFGHPARLRFGLSVCHRHYCRSRRFFGIPFFSIEFAFWRGRWRRPCVKYRFNSYTSRGLTAACRLYIQNEGLRENFWEDRENGLAKRCCSPFITDR